MSTRTARRDIEKRIFKFENDIQTRIEDIDRQVYVYWVKNLSRDVHPSAIK